MPVVVHHVGGVVGTVCTLRARGPSLTAQRVLVLHLHDERRRHCWWYVSSWFISLSSMRVRAQAVACAHRDPLAGTSHSSRVRFSGLSGAAVSACLLQGPCLFACLDVPTDGGASASGRWSGQSAGEADVNYLAVDVISLSSQELTAYLDLTQGVQTPWLPASAASRCLLAAA